MTFFFFLDIFKSIKMLPFLFAYVLFFFLDGFRAHKNVVFFCLLSTKKALNYRNNLIYITTSVKQPSKKKPSKKQPSKKISNVKRFTQNQGHILALPLIQRQILILILTLTLILIQH